VYRAAAADGRPVPTTHALVIVKIRTAARGLRQRLPMVVVADGLRSVFDGGETLAVLSDSVIAVLCERTETLPLRAALARSVGGQLLERDELTGPATITGWIEALPTTSAMADRMLSELSR
jgi:hypothetical protein